MPAEAGVRSRTGVDQVDDDMPPFWDPDELDTPTPQLTEEQHLALDMEELDLDPDDPDDRVEYQRLLTVGAEAAAEIPPELLAAMGRMVEATRVAEIEVAWARFGTSTDGEAQEPAESIAEVADDPEVVQAVGRALAAVEAMKIEARRHPAYLRRLTIQRWTYRLRRVTGRMGRPVGRARRRRTRRTVRSSPRKSRAPDGPEPDPDPLAERPGRASGLSALGASTARTT